MPADFDAANSTSQSPAEMPSQGIRTTISFLLFVHFFCVTIALTGAFAASPLQARLARMMRPYTQFLAFDLNKSTFFAPFSAPYYLTHGREFDVDHLIEVELVAADGAETRVLRLPEDEYPGGLAHDRRQTLAKLMRLMAPDEVDSEEVLSLFAQTMGGYLLQENDATSSKFRVRRHLLISIETNNTGSAEQRDPYSAALYSTAYEALVELADDGEILVIKQSTTSEVAPVDDPSGP